MRKTSSRIIAISIIMLLLVGSVAVGKSLLDAKGTPTVSSYPIGKKVVASGEFVGIKINMGGLLVVGEDDIQSSDGTMLASPARIAGIKKGDLITHISGRKLESVEEFVSLVQKQKGKPAELIYKRNGQEQKTTFSGIYDAGTGDYKIGAWVKDTAMGLGTITYYDPKTKKYVGVGHTILDEDTKSIVPFETGEIYEGVVTGITKGTAGSPGEIKGTFASSKPLGSILDNSNRGIKGILYKSNEKKTFDIADENEIKTGPAYLMSEPFGVVEKFNCVIENVSKFGDKDKSITIHITDNQLLERTGGIIQGMSGSPIIQNNKLIGTLTHVYINDPTRGYAATIKEVGN